MLKRIAIEPEARADWTAFCLLKGQFGVECGRLIPEYPGKWRRRVLEAVARREKKGELPPVRAKAIKDRIVSDWKFSALVSAGVDFDPKQRWLVNAEQSDKFSAIVAAANPRRCPKVLVADGLDTEDERFAVPRQANVSRKAAHMAEAAAVLLESAREMQIIDPHFNPTVRRWQKPLLEFLKVGSRSGAALRKLRIHTRLPGSKDRRGLDVDRIAEECRRMLENHLPSETDAQLFLWESKESGQRFHARYLITELGGLQFDHGFDEGSSLDDKTVVTLMGNEHFKDVRLGFADEEHSNTFEISAESKFRIHGTMKP